jgi:hypothetical protein
VEIETGEAFPGAPCQIWYDVPGYGLVNWGVEQLAEHARYLVGVHRPDRTVLRLTVRYGVLPWLTTESQGCKRCGARVTCRESRWALAWLGPLAVDQTAVEAQR